jgi:hypothetical protein
MCSVSQRVLYNVPRLVLVRDEQPGWATWNFDSRDIEWHRKASCRGKADADFDPFFPPRGGSAELEARAYSLCRFCPVRQECLDYALAHDIQDGIWGGMKPMQRKRLVHHEKSA